MPMSGATYPTKNAPQRRLNSTINCNADDCIRHVLHTTNLLMRATNDPPANSSHVYACAMRSANRQLSSGALIPVLATSMILAHIPPTSLLASPPTTALYASRTAGPGTPMTKPTTYSLKGAKPQPSMQPALAPYQQCAQAPNSTQEIHAQLPTPQASTIQLRNSTLRSNLIASTCVHE